LNALERAEQEFARRVDAGDFASDSTVAEALRLLRERRALDLSFLSPREQADLIASRSVDLLPSTDDLCERIQARARKGAALHVKFGIDPTSPNVHIGHAVPMILMSRFQRMGHEGTRRDRAESGPRCRARRSPRISRPTRVRSRRSSTSRRRGGATTASGSPTTG